MAEATEDKRGKKVTRWRGLLAPYGKPTGDKRRFASAALSARELPLALKWQRTDSAGHTTSVVIGDVDGMEFADEGVYGVGTLFDPDPATLPRLAEDVAEARLLLDRKVIGPSVDLDDMDFRAIGTPDEIEALAAQGQRPEIEVTRGRISAATLVPIPAFAEARPFELFEVDPPEAESDEPGVPEEDESDFALFRRRGKINNPGGRNQHGGPYSGNGDGGGDDSKVGSGGGHWREKARSAAEAMDGASMAERQQIYDQAHDSAEATLEEGTDASTAREIRQALAEINGLATKYKLKRRAVRKIDTDESPPDDDDDFALQVDWDDVPLAPLATDWEPDTLDRPALVAGALVYSRAEDAALFPLCAYVEGKLTLIPRAVFTAASVLAGGQAMLPKGTQARMRGVVGGLMRRMGMTAPWNEDADALVAGAGPLAPPRAWFEVAEPDHKTALTITDDGQVYGHIADAETPHIGFAGQRVFAPRSVTGYAYFHVGAVKTAEGDEIPIGKITMGAGHADLRYGYRAAAEHYDNSARAVAIVRAVDGNHGIWACGALVPGLSEEQIAEFRRSPVSGDWRQVGGSMELVAALAVNTPGFPIPRTQTRVSGGRELAMVAAGVLVPEGWQESDAPQNDDDRVRNIVRVTLDEEDRRRRRAAALVASLDQGTETGRQARAARAAQVLGV
jgi:hypothetical protein